VNPALCEIFYSPDAHFILVGAGEDANKQAIDRYSRLACGAAE